MILVTGATGNVGGALVHALASSGTAVRALVRREVDLPAELALGDLNDPDSVAAALPGVSGVFLLSGYDRMDETLAHIRAAGVSHVVLLSASAAETGLRDNAVSAYHLASEEMVKDSGVGWTILRPRTFMVNTRQWIPQVKAGDVVRAAFPSVRVAAIDPVDIGAVASLAFSGHVGETLALTGPESLTPGDRVRILGEALGRDLRFEGLSDEEAWAEMSASMPEKYAKAFYSFFADGALDESEVLPTVEQVLGRPPRTFAQWCAANADAFR
ncbi:NAD(P)H-binding protein [Nonomuraea sp. NPDC050556]|uniref:NAD(P)H-binding protein n=1 Tax=Nonomuraea sp. NPDC050556 TaxID=3364369 RepID=UPI0037B40875